MNFMKYKHTTCMLALNLFSAFMLLISKHWSEAIWAFLLCYWCWGWKEQKDSLDKIIEDFERKY